MTWKVEAENPWLSVLTQQKDLLLKHGRAALARWQRLPWIEGQGRCPLQFHLLHPWEDRSLLLTHSGPYAWKCQTGSWKSPWSILLVRKSWPGDVGAGFVVQDDVLNLFVGMAWNACGTLPPRRACAHRPLHW